MKFELSDLIMLILTIDFTLIFTNNSVKKLIITK
jgi:hypothetical protein